MTSRTRRAALALVGGLVALGSVIVPSVASPAPAPAVLAGACTDTTGITVVVDFSAFGDGVVVRCAPQPVRSGFDALTRAGFTFAGTTQFPGLLCRINGEPASDPCHGAPPPNAYWGYWHAPRGGSWTYSSSGAGSRVPPAGSVEGWSFGDRDEPGMAPPAPATTSTTTRPPTTPTTLGSLGGPVTATPTTADAQGGGAGATSTTAPDGSTSTTSEPGPSVPRAEDDGADGENALRGESASATEPAGDDGGSPVGVVVAALAALALGGAAAITTKRRRSHEAGG